MRKTFLEQNPFYILEVSPNEKRASIISKAEEKAFFSDGNECEEAQAKLLNPEKRLTAELDWFCGVSIEKIADIYNSISETKEISFDDLSGISRLNAILHNFSISNYDDYFELGYAVLELDELYESIDLLDILSTINTCHQQSGIREVSKDELDREFNKKRDQIRQLVSDKIVSLNEEDYIDFITMIAEKCIADENYDDGVVINDIIDQYEIRMQSVIEDKSANVINIIENIESFDDKNEISLVINNLIESLKDFDKYAQPIQIKSAINGIDHEQSSKLAKECRELAIELHNEYHNADASFKLIHALRDIFPELIEFHEIIQNDEKQIQKLKKEKEQFNRNIETHRQADKRYLVDIHGDKFVIPPFCTCCMKPTTNKENVSYSMTTQHGNTKTTRSIAVDMPICDECLKHRSQYNWLLVLICFISIAIGSIFMAILMAAEADGFLSFILGAGLTIGSYYILSAIWKTKPLSKEHSTRGKSARIFSLFLGGLALRNMPNLSNVTFTFYNWEYAQLFREANGDTASDVKEANETNTAKTTSVLKANEHPVANMFKMIGVFVAIALLIGMIFESANSGRNYNTNGYTNNDYNYDNDYNYGYQNNVETYTVTLDKQGGTGGTSSVTATDGEELPYASAPTRYGYEFNGYYSKQNGLGTKYYDSNMRAVANWYGSSNETIYAYWIKESNNNNYSGISVTRDNFEDYFTLTTDAEFVGDNVKITYSIKPKSNAYAKSSKSSDTIKVEIGAVVSSLSFYYGEPSWNEKYTVTLSKSKNYTASGSFSFSYYSITETVYWIAEATYCSGSIGE